jgi:hypothetical protein
MSDLLGAKTSAKNMRKQMELSDKAPDEGRQQPEHEASRRERETINSENNAGDGDYKKGSGREKRPKESFQ